MEGGKQGAGGYVPYRQYPCLHSEYGVTCYKPVPYHGGCGNLTFRVVGESKQPSLCRNHWLAGAIQSLDFVPVTYKEVGFSVQYAGDGSTVASDYSCDIHRSDTF